MRTAGKTFENQVILAEDGDEFLDCTFINCTVDWASGSTPIMERCYFKGTLGDAAVIMRPPSKEQSNDD